MKNPFYTITSEIFRPGRIPMRRTMANDRRVTIERKKLVEKLKENRGRHQEIYEEALAGYQEALHTALVGMGEKAIELGSQAGSIDLDQNQLFAPVTKLSKPHHALDSYSEAIEVFEWDEAEQVELTVVEFRSYVLDKWDWQEGWLAENANYSQSARMAMAEL